MSDRTLDALAGLVFVIIILGLEYLGLDVWFFKSFLWVFAILFHAYVFGKNAFAKQHWIVSAPFGLLLLLAVQSVIQTVWFYAGGALGSLSDAWSLVIAMAAAHLAGAVPDTLVFGSKTQIVPLPAWSRKRTLFAAILIAASLAVLCYVVWGAWQARTMVSIRTPWPVLPAGTLAAVALLWMLAALAAVALRVPWLTAIQSVLALLGTLCLAPIVYRLGYGFDGFLHLAGEQVLAKTGTLDPKPLYYMGQYVFVTWLNRVLDIPLPWIDRWLVPMVAAFLLPAASMLTFRHHYPNAGTVLALALMPLGFFVSSTPQGFALVLGLAGILTSFGMFWGDTRQASPLWLCLWATCVHPLAGVPLLVLSIAVVLAANGAKALKWLAWICAVLAGFSVPVLFFVASRYSGLNIEWSAAQLVQLATWANTFEPLIPWLGNTYTLWPAWASLIAVSLPALGVALAIGSIVVSEKKLPFGLLLAAAVSLLVGAGLMQNAGDFAFLIQYEREDYAQRLGALSTMLLVIASMPAMAWIFDKLRTAWPLVSLVGILLFGAVGAANAYNSLPRHDAVQASRGWSVGRADVEAVKWIDRRAGDRPYTVLANQTVAAAAVNEFGFKRYAEDVFFYPIPTGGPLYQVYLKMTYEDPSLETVREAARLGKSDLVFVVINDYWWKAEELNERIGLIAQDSWDIENGKVKIYVFDVAKK